MTHKPRVTLAYATAAGSTAEIAQCIAGVLRHAGCDVACAPAGPDTDPTGSDAVVLGSAVHNMAWLTPAVDLLERTARSSGPRPVWCFSVGGVEPRGPLTRVLGAQERRRIEERFPPGLIARDHHLFGGVVDMTHLPLWGRLFYLATGGRAGDRRNWPAIQAWAATIANELTGQRETIDLT